MFRLCKSSPIASSLAIHRHLSTSTPLGRKVLIPNYPLKKKPGKFVSVEIAEPADFQAMKEYSQKNFSNEESLGIALGCDPTAYCEYIMVPALKRALRFPYTVMIMDEGKIVGFALTSIEVFDKNRILPPVSLEDQGEYVDEVTNDLGIPTKAERIWTGLIQYTTDVVPHFLPKARKHVVAHDELLSVNKDYTGNGLAKVLMAAGIKELANDRVCDYYFGNPTAHGTSKAGARVGVPERWRLPFQDIKLHGEHMIKPGVGKIGLGAIGVHVEPIDKLLKIKL